MNTLIVCHAGAGLGLGHLARSLVVARALNQTLGAHVCLLIQGDAVQRDDLNQFTHRFLGLDDNLVNAIDQTVVLDDVHLVVFDVHPRLVPADLENLLLRLRNKGCKLVAVDALASYRDYLNLVFIPSFRFAAPPKLVGAAPVVFGWDCFLLNVKQPPVAWGPGQNVLVLSGGSDATGLGKTLPCMLNEALPANAELHWVTGPFAQQPGFPPAPRIRMTNHQSPPGLDALMQQANYAMTVYGVSFFELLYYGIPTVVFSPYGDKDDAELAGVAEAGVALVARDEPEAVGLLKKLMADDRLARTLSQRAREKMSISGGEKFARAVAKLMGM